MLARASAGLSYGEPVMNDAAARLAVVRGAVPVDLGGAVLVESWSNDTWITGRLERLAILADRPRVRFGDTTLA
jgi:hypothetical protein